MPYPDPADDMVIARSIDEAALAQAIRNNLDVPADDSRCRSNDRNGHVIERYLKKTPAGRKANGHPRNRERHDTGIRAHPVTDTVLRQFRLFAREKNATPFPAGTDTDLLWLDEPQTLYLKKKLHVHDSVTFAGNLAHFFSSACVRDAMQKVRLVSELRSSADRVPFPLFAVDCDGKIIAWNRAMESLTGTPALDMIGRRTAACATLLYGYTRHLLVDSLIRSLSRPRNGGADGMPGPSGILNGRAEMIWLQGGPRHIQCRARYIHNDEGGIIGAIQSVGVLEPPAPLRTLSEQILSPAGPVAEPSGAMHGSGRDAILPSARIPSAMRGEESPGGSASPATALPAFSDPVMGRKQEDLTRAIGELAAAEDELLHNIRRLSERQSLPAGRGAESGVPVGLADRVIGDAREGIIVFDTSLRCILWNPFMEQLTGMPASEVTGRHAFDMFPDFEHSDADLLLSQALSGTMVESSDLSFRLSLTGKQAWIRLILSPLHDRSGSIAGIVAVVQDTTARRVMEYALESTIVQLMESEEKYRSVFNAKNDPLLLVDCATRKILDLNEAASDLYGYSRSEFLDLSFGTLFCAPEHYEGLLVARSRGIRMYRQCRKDTTTFPADISFANFDLRGRDLLLLSIRDTTDLHETTEALRLANTKLNLLIGITRHDVINNLTVAMGYNDLLRNTVRDEKILTMLEKEENALQTIHRQIDFTREYYNLGVRSPIWQNVCDISTRAYSQLVTTVAYTCETRDLEIYADPLLEKVFLNLFDNALRHGESVLNIRVYWTREGTDIVLVFGDDGVGIPAENKERIFRKGFGHHTGLGLFLAREILAITRIGIAETGEFEKGARFELRIPAGRYRFPESAGAGEALGSGDMDFLS